MKTRKLLAVVVAVAMLVSLFSVPVFAAGEATIVADLGILVGDGSGVTADYLAKTASKLQGAMVNLRLLGLDADALAFTGTDTFTDAGDATAYWAPILAYYKANTTLGFQGPGDGSFGVTENLTAQMFNKVLLVALGYVEGVDFTWATVDTFAASIGLTALAGKTTLTNEDMAIAIVEALGLDTTKGITLMSQLVEGGVYTQAQAQAAGFVVTGMTLSITDAYASGVKVITVATNIDIPSGAVITLKKGTVGLNVATIATDGNTATLTGYFNFTAGTYTVMVDGATYTFTITAEGAVDLQINASSIFDMGSQDLQVKLSNQYGEAMSLAGATVTVIDTNGGATLTPTVTTTVKVDATGLATHELYVFVYDTASMLSVQGTVVVNAKPELKGISFGDVTIKDGKADIFKGTTGHTIAINAVDQYGNPYKLAAGPLPAGVTLIESNGPVLGIGAIDANGNLEFNADNAGTTILTMLITAEGVVAQSAPITVLATPVLTTVEIAGATETMYVGEETTLATAGFDQYGDPIALTNDVTFTSTLPNFDIDPVTGKVTPGTAGVGTVFYFLNGSLQGTFTIEVNGAAVPQVITAMDVTPALQTGVAILVDSSAKATVLDQYGRVMTDAQIGAAGYDVMITATAATHIALTAAPGTGLTYKINADGTAGSETFLAYLTDDHGVTPIAVSVFSFAVTNVSAAEITTVTMSVDNDGLIYTGDKWNDLHQEDMISGGGISIFPYDEAVIFTGATTSGDSVVLLDDDADGIPDIIDVITFSEIDILGFDYDTDADFPNTLTIYDMNGSFFNGEVEMIAWRNGVAAATTTLTLKSDDPVVTELYHKVTTLVAFPENFPTEEDYIDFIIGSNLVVKDQYGKLLDIEAVLGDPIDIDDTDEEYLLVIIYRENGYQMWKYIPEENGKFTEVFSIILNDGMHASTVITTEWPFRTIDLIGYPFAP